MDKKVYEAPKLTVHGDVEDITLGTGNGNADYVLYGLSDPGHPGPSTSGS